MKNCWGKNSRRDFPDLQFTISTGRHRRRSEFGDSAPIEIQERGDAAQNTGSRGEIEAGDENKIPGQ